MTDAPATRTPRRRRRLVIICTLVGLTLALLAIERTGVSMHPRNLRVGGDLRRESRLFEQYGQVASALVIAVLIWTLDPPRRRLIVPMVLTLLVTAGVVLAMKQTIGRARPSAQDSAADTRPASGDNDSKMESFPSGHTAAAVATTVVLAALYPSARGVFWGLALVCAALRYINNAHWPSDVVAGIAVGYLAATTAWYVLVERHDRHFAGTISPAGEGAAAAPPAPQN